MQKSLRFDDSFFDRFSEEDFKRTTNAENAEKTVDQNKLRTEGRKQFTRDEFE